MRTKSKSELLAENEKLKEKFTQTFNSGPSPMIISEIESGEIIDVNRGFANMIMYLREELIGKNVFELNLWVNTEDRAKYIKKMKEDKRVSNLEINLRAKSGDIRATLISGEILTIKDKPYLLTSGTDITERKHSELELEKSEEKLRAIFDSVADAIVETDISGNILKVNKAVLRIYGSDSEKDFIGKNALGFYAKEDRARTLKAYRQTHYESIVEDSEFTALKVDGTPFPVQITSVVLRDANDKPIGFVGIIKDITERKQSENEVQKSEERYRSVVENAGELIWQVDTEGKFVFFNNYAEKLSGQKSADWGGKHFAPLVHPDDLTHVNKIFEDTLAGKTIEYETRIFNKDAEIINLEVQTMPVYVQGEVTGTLNFGRDITERKRSEKALKESEEKYRELFEAESDALFLIDNETGNIIESNMAAEKLYGYTKKELAKKKNTDLSAESYKTQKVTEKTSLNIENVVSIPLRYHKKRDGTSFPVEITGRFFNWKGKPVHIAAIRDITERKLAEEALIESEERFRRLAENSPDIIYRHRLLPNPEFEYISPAITKISGYTPEEHYNDPELGFKIIHPDDKPDLDKLAIGKFSNSPHISRWIHKDGGTIWIEDKHSPVYDVEGNLSAVEGVARDITERKNAEEALQESERRLATLMSNLPGMAYRCKNDANWTMEFISDGGYSLTGYRSEELVGTLVSYAELIHPDDRQMVWDNVQEAIEKKQPFQLRYRITTASGEQKWVWEKGQAIFGPNGDVISLEGFITDITELKKAEEALKQNEFFLNEAQRMANLGSYNLDILSGYWTSSEELNDVFGIDDDYDRNVEGWSNIVHPEDKEDMISYLSNIVFKEHQNFDKEYRIIRISDNTERWVHGLGELEFNKEGQPVKMMGTIQDITESKIAEEKLRASRNQLRSLAERLQMIREEERATIAREIHDDLGQTLTALKMDIAWLKKNSGMTEEMRASKMDIMLSLTDSTIQTVKRIATELRPGILDDLGLVSAIEWQTREFQNRSGIECNFEIVVDEFTVEDDISIAVFRIFQESLTNVARHSGATKVTVTLKRIDDLLQMEITDNGVGINEDQISSSNSLGLIGMNERVSVFKGKLTVSRAAEGGTIVRVYFPIGKA